MRRIFEWVKDINQYVHLVFTQPELKFRQRFFTFFLLIQLLLRPVLLKLWSLTWIIFDLLLEDLSEVG